MENSLLKIIEEQAMFGFTGRINLVDTNTGQLIGNILMKDGPIVNALYRGLQGQKALVSAYVEGQISPGQQKYIVEPEVINDSQAVLNLTVSDLKNVIKTIGKEALEAKKLRPPNALRLIINDEFVINGSDIGQEEFSVMKVITDFNKVEDIYAHCPLQEHQITLALVSLRKKGALKVFKNDNIGG